MKFSINGYEFVAKINRFPSGELGVVLPNGLPATVGEVVVHYDWVEYRDSGLSVIAQLLDAIDRRYSCSYQKILSMPYVPYSRQDRVCNKGESFSLKAFTSIINSFGFNRVITWDNHSDVATALINNCTNVSQESLIAGQGFGVEVAQKSLILISPDNGSIKKTRAIAKFFGADKIVRCDKERDISTGRIVSTSVLDKELVLMYDNFLVVDDLCEKGGTFLGLAKEVKKINPSAKLYLYVTHGFFSGGGMEELKKYYHKIYTTDSVYRGSYRNVEVIKHGW